MELGIKKIFFLFFSVSFFSLISFNSVFAYACPNYMFATDLKFGNSSPDVRVIQEILNLDKRTVVSLSGVGSAGNETNYFGKATREALKRFQALFIEYVGIADGKFDSRTRTTMNAVCKGAFFSKGSGNVYDAPESGTSNDKFPPVVAIAGPTSAEVNVPFRAFLAANEPIQTPAISNLIISNATAGDLRKVSSTTYSFLVTPNPEAIGNITLQFEAESLSDLAGNKNEKATNEWVVTLNISLLPTPDISFDIPTVELPVITPSVDCSTVSSLSINDYNNPCYGKVPMSYEDFSSEEGGGGGGGGGMQEMIQKLLEGLMQGLQGLGGLAGGGGGQGGTGTVKAGCACARGKTTILLTPKGGLGKAGFYVDTINPGPGDYVGTPAMGPQYCGWRVEDGNCKGQFLNVLGQPVIGIIPPSPAFVWER